jgi:hypothetical protein
MRASPPPAGDPRARVAAICGALPEVAASGDQHVAFRVRGRTFAWYLEDHHGDGRVALCCKAAPGEQQALVAADPARYYRPAYLGARGWVAVRLDTGDVDWDEVAELALEAWRRTAPKRLLARVEEGGQGSL